MTARVQENRTTTPNAPPANNSLQVGELFVEMATPLRLWTGVPTTIAPAGVKLILDATAQATANQNAVQKAGDTMTGPLVLSGNPTTAAQAANKAYADGLLVNTVLQGNPTAPTPALGDADQSLATTAFVANTIAAGPPAGAIVAPTPPTVPTPIPGTLWWSSTDGQLYLRYDDGNSQQWVTAANVEGLANAATKQDVAALSANVGRNLIHNSMFNIAQRGVGPFTANAAYTLDRWKMYFAGGSMSVGQFPQTDGGRAQIGDEASVGIFNNAFVGTAGAGDVNFIVQPIEDIRRLSGKTVTISFWAAASAILKLGVSLDQVFGTTGASATVVLNGQSVTLATTWQRYSLTFTLPSASGMTITAGNFTQLDFWFSAGSGSNTRSGNVGVQSGTVYLWGVQLEIAAPGQTQPTPLEKPDPELQLRQCQRFYQVGSIVGGSYALAGNTVYVGGLFPVLMRAAPTVVNTGFSGGNLTGTFTPGSTAASFYISGVTNTAATYIFNNSFSASADL